jgi:hypothetical protein
MSLQTVLEVALLTQIEQSTGKTMSLQTLLEVELLIQIEQRVASEAWCSCLTAPCTTEEALVLQ